MKRMNHVLALACILAGIANGSAAIPDTVRLDTGLISGTNGSAPEIRVFKGIPYAAPPVGALRWAEPMAPAPWQGVRKANQFGPVCMQSQGNGASPGSMPAMSEDCLYLNVWTAAGSAKERRPVLIWSHGGGYQTGSGGSPQFDGENLARKGVVLVTYNYRLGVFGFFAHPELSKESGRNASGNYGLMDLAEVLRWVRRNINAFGGDPKRVTIVGVSAGAGLVANLVGSPQAKGLFQRGIAQSGGWMGLSIGKPMTLKDAETAGVKVAEAAGAHSLADLRSKPADQVLKLGRGTGPIVDGWFIPQELSKIYSQGRQNDVDMLVGSNKDEGTFFATPASVTAEQFVKQARRRFGELSDTFLKLYPAGSDAEANASQLASFRDELRWHMTMWAAVQSKRGKARAYLYYFTHEPPRAEGAPFRGATHGAETAYMFGNLPAGRTAWTEIDRKLADMMSSYWANFAAHGNPNGEGLPVWPAYGERGNDRAMVLGDSIVVGLPPEEERLSFYDKYYLTVR